MVNVIVVVVVDLRADTRNVNYSKIIKIRSAQATTMNTGGEESIK